MLYGRDDERAAIGALLEGARISRSGTVVLRGEAGIGKSALLEDARARAGDMHVLAARGVESEAELPFAALHQLLRPALMHIEALPSPQATALRSALGLAEGAGQERFLVFSACLSLLSELAEERPVLCLVDDAHWLDAASADALQFVARRLDAEGIVLLFAARDGEARVFEAADIRSVTLEGLNAEAADALLERAGIDAAPTVREQLLAQTEGNALALVELPTVLTQRQLSGEEPLPEVLPMTHQLESVFYERVRRLPDATRLVLLVAAADDSEALGVVYRAGEQLGVGAGALDAAEHAGLVMVHRTRLEFRHPLVRSAVYGAATSSERRAAHRALAETLAEAGDRDRRAWHLAASTLQPDDDVVRALEEAAERSAERAGHMAAAKALMRAAELSPDLGHRGRCLVRAASNLSVAGRDEHAVTTAKQALEIVEEPELRAQLAHVRELAAVRSGRPHDVVPALVEAARDVAPTAPAMAMQLLVDAADAVWNVGDRDGYLEITRLAGTIALPGGDETSRMYADSLAGFAAMIEGDTASGVRLLGEVAAWGDRASEPRQVVWASYAAQWLGDEARFGVLIDRAAALARRRGELGILADALGMRAGQRALTQQFEEAAIAATEALQFARELKAANLELYPRAALAIVSAVRGLDEEARGHAAAVLELATANGSRLRASMAVYALALVDLGRARWEDALEGLDSLLEGGSTSLDPFAGHVFPDRIEAAVRASRPEVAEAAFPLFEAWAGYAGAPSAQPRLAVARAMLAEGDDATARFEEALAFGEQARPFDFARTQLLYGEHLRRVRRRADARVQLRAALEGFERLRAEPWAERARAELRASGETARRRDPTTVDQLTPQELQIARFVAQGLANKEVASQLFLSPRTIDSHLRNVFAKLGIKSRTQLARLPLGDLDDVGLSGATATSI